MDIKKIITEELAHIVLESITKNFTRAIETYKKIQLNQQDLRKAFVNEKDPKKKEKLKQGLIKMHSQVVKAEKEFNKALQTEPVEDDLTEKKNKGLWANIHAKRKRGEKPAHKNSKAHKSAVKAAKAINKNESVNEASDQQRLTHLRKFGIAPNNQPQNAAYIKQVSKPGKFFVDWKDAFKLGDVALEFVNNGKFDIIDLKTMKRTGKQLDVKKGQLGNLRTTYGVRVNESKLTEAKEDYKYKKQVGKAFDKINDAMFNFRHAFGVKQLTNDNMKLKKKFEALQANIFALQREMRSDGLSEGKLTEGEKEALLGDPKMDKSWAKKTDRLSKSQLQKERDRLKKAGFSHGNIWSGSKENMIKFHQEQGDDSLIACICWRIP